MPSWVARAFRTFRAAAFAAGWRGRRVTALLAAVAVLSLADLYMTMVHLMTFGMLEGNPIARYAMATWSPAALVTWKLVTVAFAVGVLFALRRRWTAELAAVFCCGVMLWLTVRWAAYNEQVTELTREMHEIRPSDAPQWVTMQPGG